MLALALCVFFALWVILAGLWNSTENRPSDPQGGTSDTHFLVVQLINEDGLLVKNAVKKYVLTDLTNPENADVIPSTFASGEGRLDAQVPVSLKLSVKTGEAYLYKIELADNSAFADAAVSYVEAPSGTYAFSHLLANTTYYYRVCAVNTQGQAGPPSREFYGITKEDAQ